ncbi:CYTH domain-containing protein [Chitinilyticum aquatile]|uniref:CYTH domain-containing protein n=1 Tax=Chitinilyticum aquatile TaxID=362520 RepID=UPI000412FB4E|nr:CYTH domain-containing protein [Chitinilyticum aquatile]
MATEIERKYLLASDAWRVDVTLSTRIAQGYLSTEPGRTVRVRIKGAGGFLTIKGASFDGMSRAEFEYPVPLSDAEAMLALCPSVLDKTRHLVDAGNGLVWEIDEFHGENAGLIVAEIELPSVDAPVPQPGWLGAEVTGDKRYYNSQLTLKPYTQWQRGICL